MHLSEHTQDLVEGLADEPSPAKPTTPPQRPDAASALFGLGFGLSGAAVLACTILEELGQHSEAITRFVSIAWVLVTMAWLMSMNRRATRRVQATVQKAEREMGREFKLLRAELGLRLAEVRQDGYADGFVAGTSASINGRAVTHLRRPERSP
jgi:hypothetical protein